MEGFRGELRLKPAAVLEVELFSDEASRYLKACKRLCTQPQGQGRVGPNWVQRGCSSSLPALMPRKKPVATSNAKLPVA